MSDINDFYPLKKDGSWHNGGHIRTGNDIISVFPGQLVAYRKLGKMIHCDGKYFEYLSKDDYEALPVEYKKKYKKLEKTGDVYKRTQPLTEAIIQAISKILGVEAFGDFLLFRHIIMMGKNEFPFYSLFMHLDAISDGIIKSKEISEEIAYINTAKRSIVIFPHEIMAQEGGADGKIFYQKEYFIPKNITDQILNDTHFFLSGNECCEIAGDVETYKLSYNDEHETQTFEKGTYFKITEFADNRRYPDIFQIEPLFIPIEIRKWEEDQKSTKSAMWAPFFLQILISSPWQALFLLQNRRITSEQIESIRFSRKIELTKINGNEECKSIELEKLVIPNFDRNEIFLRAEDYKQYEPFYVRLKPSVFKEIYYEKNRTLYLRKRANLDTYKVHPQLVCKAESKGTIHIAEPIRIKKSDIAAVYEKDDVRFEKIKGGRFNAYYKYNENFIKLPADFTDLFENITKDFCFLRKDELKELDEIKGSDVREKKSTKLLEIIKNKGGKSEKSCAFEHECEWNKKTDSSVLDIRARFIKEQTAIWDRNYTNKELPEDIRECSSFTYFYHSQFEHFLRKLHKKYAENLILAQQIVIHKWMYKQGNLGLYPGLWDENENENENKNKNKNKPKGFAPDDQTFCNHAVYETIKQVDKNYLKFTADDDTAPWDVGKHTDLAPAIISDYKQKKLRKSNLWCDVLGKQSENSAKTGIYKLTVQQAFYMAQLGYAVIASWKNTAGGSPHFVTVVPKDYQIECPKKPENLMVAHVGGGENREKNLKTAFKGTGNNTALQKYNEVLFYGNIHQNFI